MADARRESARLEIPVSVSFFGEQNGNSHQSPSYASTLLGGSLAHFRHVVRAIIAWISVLSLCDLASWVRFLVVHQVALLEFAFDLTSALIGVPNLDAYLGRRWWE